MAIGTGKPVESSDVQRKLFTGLGKVKIVNVNPTKAELEKLGVLAKEEPVYLSKSKVKVGDTEKEVATIRLTFWAEIMEDGFEGNYVPISYFLYNMPNIGSQSGKYVVLNKYGMSTWLDKEAIESKILPENMKWFNIDGLKIAYRGEDQLVEMIKQWYNIPGLSDKLDDPKEAECTLDSISEYFKGNLKELQETIKKANGAQMKFVFGVRTTDDNKMYQDILTRLPLRKWQSDISYINKKIEDFKSSGAYANTNFGDIDYLFREYRPEKTNIKSKDKENIWGATSDIDDDLGF